MFTGIIQKVSTIADVDWQKGSLFARIKIPQGWTIKLGESISINGVCSTVRFFDKEIFEVEYMPETVKKTKVGNYEKGNLVNLEKSLRLQDLLDGHIVQSHVDCTGEVMAIKKVEAAVVLKVKISEKFMRLVAEKGSIAVDGISLTVVDVGKDWFTVSLVSYTLENTNLGTIQVGDIVNIETDVIAKYLDKLTQDKK